jgi:phosphatidylglycerol:prolipoprotein diacylglycerol transferase
MRDIFLEWAAEAGVPSWLIPDYWFMLTSAIIVGSLTCLHLWKDAGHDVRTASELIFWGIPSLFVGAKLFHMFQFGWEGGIWGLFSPSGLAMYGGLFGLLSAWAVYYLFSPFRVAPFLDCVTPALALGLSIGRVGCFLAGCDGGIATRLPWSVSFPSGTSSYSTQLRDGLIDRTASLSLPSHPTQLYESIFALVAFGLLWRVLSRKHWPGEVFLTGLLWYSAFRFASEPLRADMGGWHPFGVLTFSQMISLVVGVLALTGILYLGRKG